MRQLPTGLFALLLAGCALVACSGPIASTDAGSVALSADGGGATGDGGTGDARDAASFDATDSAADASAHDAAKGPLTCSAASFPSLLAVAEASSAAEVELVSGVREMIIVSDSGHSGAALVVGLPDANTKRAITLALDAAASDDIEGSAWHDGTLYTLTSSGAVRRFVPDGNGGLDRKGGATAIGPAPYACADLTAFNCGKNYEGLCLRANTAGHHCAGYAASKAEGALYCVVIDQSGALSIDTTTPPLALGLPNDHLSDCAFGATGVGEDALVVATNLLGNSRSYRVDESTAKLELLAVPQVPNLEAIALDRDGAVYVFDDNSTAISTAGKAACSGW